MELSNGRSFSSAGEGEVEEELHESAGSASNQEVVHAVEVEALLLHVQEHLHVSEDLRELPDGAGHNSGEGLGDVAGVNVGEVGSEVEELAQGALPIEQRVRVNYSFGAFIFNGRYYSLINNTTSVILLFEILDRRGTYS